MDAADPAVPPSTPRIALAANRHLGCRVLDWMREQNVEPVALMVAAGKSADVWAGRMCDRVPHIPILRGKAFRDETGLQQLQRLDVDYLVSIHFPYIVPAEVLRIPRRGTLNLHPAYLPFNRGWHTPSWAIHEGTPYGATLHWMDEGVDTGDIALQEMLHVDAGDTADRLYQRVLDLEFQLFVRAFPLLCRHRLPRVPQSGAGTEHRRQDLASRQQLRLAEQQTVGDTLRHLRALTTNSWDEAAYFVADGRRYRVRVEIQADKAVDRASESQPHTNPTRKRVCKRSRQRRQEPPSLHRRERSWG